MGSSSGLFMDLTAFAKLLEYEHVRGCTVNMEVKAENKGQSDSKRYDEML